MAKITKIFGRMFGLPDQTGTATKVVSTDTDGNLGLIDVPPSLPSADENCTLSYHSGQWVATYSLQAVDGSDYSIGIGKKGAGTATVLDIAARTKIRWGGNSSPEYGIMMYSAYNIPDIPTTQFHIACYSTTLSGENEIEGSLQFSVNEYGAILSKALEGTGERPVVADADGILKIGTSASDIYVKDLVNNTATDLFSVTLAEGQGFYCAIAFTVVVYNNAGGVSIYDTAGTCSYHFSFGHDGTVQYSGATGGIGATFQSTNGSNPGAADPFFDYDITGDVVTVRMTSDFDGTITSHKVYYKFITRGGEDITII
jgi:hypothetical protein